MLQRRRPLDPDFPFFDLLPLELPLLDLLLLEELEEEISSR